MDWTSGNKNSIKEKSMVDKSNHFQFKKNAWMQSLKNDDLFQFFQLFYYVRYCICELYMKIVKDFSTQINKHFNIEFKIREIQFYHFAQVVAWLKVFLMQKISLFCCALCNRLKLWCGIRNMINQFSINYRIEGQLYCSDRRKSSNI